MGQNALELYTTPTVGGGKSFGGSQTLGEINLIAGNFSLLHKTEMEKESEQNCGRE